MVDNRGIPKGPRQEQQMVDNRGVPKGLRRVLQDHGVDTRKMKKDMVEFDDFKYELKGQYRLLCNICVILQFHACALV